MTSRSAAERGPGTTWVRYRLAKDEIVLTFRVPEGTPMVMEQAGWEVEGAVIEDTAAVPLDVERLAQAFRLTFRSRYHERFAKPLAAEYARLSADEESGT